MQKSLILMGMKHSGKTSLGRRLARAWKTSFWDLDDLIVAQNSEGRENSAREVYQKLGKEAFARRETLAAEEAVSHFQTQTGILALGGGTIENLPAIQVLEPWGFFVYLEENPDILYDRIMAGGLPAFLSPESPRQDFQILYEKRTRLMRQKAHLTVCVQGLPLDQAFQLLASKLKETEHYAR